MSYYAHKTPFINIENYKVDIDIVKIIPEEMARSMQIIAMEKFGDILNVGMVNPTEKRTIKILENKLKLKIIPLRIDIQEWANTINNNY